METKNTLMINGEKFIINVHLPDELDSWFKDQQRIENINKRNEKLKKIMSIIDEKTKS
jgi:hypothetical protein